jgi:hypothetical protein
MSLPLLAISLIYLHLPILIVVISVVYSATRYESWPSIFREAFRWGLRMSVFLVIIGALLYALATFISS